MHTTNYTTQKNASGRATPSLSIVHNYASAFTTNKPDPTPCTVIYSISVVAVFRHAQDIVTVHSFARSKLPRQNAMNDVRLFSRVLVLGNSMRIDNRQQTIDTTVPSPHGDALGGIIILSNSTNLE